MSSMSFVKGICMGAAIGAAAGMVIVSQNRKCRKLTQKAVKTIGDTVENIAGSFNM